MRLVKDLDVWQHPLKGGPLLPQCQCPELGPDFRRAHTHQGIDAVCETRYMVRTRLRGAAWYGRRLKRMLVVLVVVCFAATGAVLGRATVVAQSRPGSEPTAGTPFTSYRAALLMVRYHPELATSGALIALMSDRSSPSRLRGRSSISTRRQGESNS